MNDLWDIWTLVRFLHVLGVAVWLGGMIFLGVVAVPIARATEGPNGGRALIARVGQRFGMLGGIAWVTILVSGGLLLQHRNVDMDKLTSTDYGHRLLAKIILLLLMGFAVVVHSMWQGPKVRQLEEAEDADGVKRMKMIGGMLDAFVLVATLVALWLATSLIP